MAGWTNAIQIQVKYLLIKFHILYFAHCNPIVKIRIDEFTEYLGGLCCDIVNLIQHSLFVSSNCNNYLLNFVKIMEIFVTHFPVRKSFPKSVVPYDKTNYPVSYSTGYAIC